MSLAKGMFASLAVVAASLVMAPQEAEAGVVVASSGPSAGDYPVGTEIGDTQRFTLQSGDTVTVLDNGGTRVFRGAGTFMLARSGGASRNRAFASLTTQRSATRARTGAVRGTGNTQVTNPNLWYVDVAASGTICLADPSNVRLWRADRQAESTYTIASAENAIEVTFPAGEMLAAWDIYNPPVEGQAYSIGTGSEAVEVTFAFLEEVPVSAEDMASALIAKGCTTQLETLSNAMMGS